MIDLNTHPFAQSWSQLRQQLQQQAWNEREIDGVKRCYDVGWLLANAYGSSSGRSIAQLVLTASILAAYGTPPILVENTLVHPAYEGFGVNIEEFGDGTTAKALAQRVGLNVDRVLRAYARQDFRGAPPETEEAIAFYPLDDARTLLIRVAEAIASSSRWRRHVKAPQIPLAHAARA